MATNDIDRDPYFSHWADYAARATSSAHPDREVIVVAAGITPSGVVHIGNFREVMTVDLVSRALRDRGRNVRFIYSWDDFDVFRKVPANMPQQDLLRQNLGRSIVDVPDPHGDHETYADHKLIVAHLDGTGKVSEPNPELAAIGTYRECTDVIIRMEVPRQEVARAASLILRTYPVADISIEEVEIGTIIENLLNDRGDEKLAGAV